MFKDKNMKLNLDKDELYDLYVNKLLSTTKIAKMFNCSARTVQKYMKKYNIPARSFSEANTIFVNSRTEEDLLKRAQAFRNTYYSRSEEERARINKTRATKAENLQAAITKSRITKSTNKSSRKSKAEDAFYNSLLISFNKNDVERWYFTDPRYPYECDFYIKSKDLFIEYQGHPSHGYEPFDPTNEMHLNYLSKMTIDMTTWTVRDPKKLKCALDNNITLILVYPKHDTYLIKDGKITTIQINDLYKM